MPANINIKQVTTALVFIVGFFHLVSDKKTQDRYGLDSFFGRPQTQCTRQTAGAVLIVAAIFLNSQRGFNLIDVPGLKKPATPGPLGGGQIENFPEYETFIV